MRHKKLRKSLYMPALVATRYNPLMLDLYERLQQKGKPKKVALCAVMRKLLVISYGVLKSGQPFDVNDDGVWGETPRATLLPKSQ